MAHNWPQMEETKKFDSFVELWGMWPHCLKYREGDILHHHVGPLEASFKALLASNIGPEKYTRRINYVLETEIPQEPIAVDLNSL